MKQVEQVIMERYQIQSHIAQGGMANVYLAYDSEKCQTVAIKMVHESLNEYCERFQREVKAMAALVHEHILPILDYGKHESWHFLVTPYVDYGTLDARLTARPLTLEEVDPILSQLAAALQYAHEQGIVHRDIKPSNVLMRDGNYVYLADFGLVKRVGQESGLTVSGYLVGTPEYMAPELAEEDATPRSDVYSLGILLYQMFAGRVPFRGNTPMGVYLCHIRDEPAPPTTFNPAIPAEIEKVILHSIKKDPRQRYQSVEELYRAYQQAVKSVKDRVTKAPTAQLGKKDVEVTKQRGRMSRLLLAVALVIGIFALTSLAIFPVGRNQNIHTVDAHSRKPSTLSAHTRKIAPLLHIIPTSSNTSVTPIPTSLTLPERGTNNTSVPANSGSNLSGVSSKNSNSINTQKTNNGVGSGSSTGTGSGNSSNTGSGSSTGTGGGNSNSTGSGSSADSGSGSSSGTGSGSSTDSGNGSSSSTGSGSGSSSSTGSGSGSSSTGSGSSSNTGSGSSIGVGAVGVSATVSVSTSSGNGKENENGNGNGDN